MERKCVSKNPVTTESWVKLGPYSTLSMSHEGWTALSAYCRGSIFTRLALYYLHNRFTNAHVDVFTSFWTRLHRLNYVLDFHNANYSGPRGEHRVKTRNKSVLGLAVPRLLEPSTQCQGLIDSYIYASMFHIRSTNTALQLALLHFKRALFYQILFSKGWRTQ